VDVAGFVHLKFNTTRLNLTDSLAGVVGYSSGLGVRHEAAGSENLTELTHFGHGLRGGNCDIEVSPAFDALLDHVLETDKLSTRFASCLGRCTGLGEHQDADNFAGAMGQRRGSADHLVGLLRVNPKAEGQIDGLVELGFRSA